VPGSGGCEHRPRRAAGICREDLTEEKITAIPLLSALREQQL
jgi:hypothetical protein